MTKESFPFTVWSGLLEDGHRQRIGAALWEFLWCCRKVTKEVKRSENIVGLVLGGKPITASEIGNDLKTHPETVKTNLKRLQKEHYINLTRTPYGQIIEVNRSKKWSKSNNPKRDSENAVSPQKKRDSENAVSPQKNTVSRHSENAVSPQKNTVSKTRESLRESLDRVIKRIKELL